MTVARSEIAPATLWRHRDFMKLWVSETISLFGSQFTMLALPLIAAITLQATPAAMGILSAVETAPFLLIGLFAGVWVDRRPKRPILIAGNIGRAVLLITIPLAAIAGMLSMYQLYVVGFLVGICTVFFDVAYQSYLPMLVNRDQLVEGNSKLEVSRSAAQLTGPGLAGLLIQVLTAPIAIFLDVLSFIISALCLGLIRPTEPATTQSTRAPMLAEIREGLGVVFGNPFLRAIAGCTATSNFFSSACGALLILFATRDLNLTPAAIGIALGLGNIGGLGGALLAGRLAARIGLGRLITGSILIGGIGGLPFVFATPTTAIPAIIFSSFFLGMGSTIYNINQLSLRQAIIPQRLLGRMNATMRFLVWGTMPLGGLLGGVLGELLGLRTGMIIGAFAGLSSFLWVLFSPVRTLTRIPEPESDS
jgi:MFS family permease